MWPQADRWTGSWGRETPWLLPRGLGDLPKCVPRTVRLGRPYRPRMRGLRLCVWPARPQVVFAGPQASPEWRAALFSTLPMRRQRLREAARSPPTPGKRQRWDVSPGLRAPVHGLLVAQLPGLAVGEGRPVLPPGEVEDAPLVSG